MRVGQVHLINGLNDSIGHIVDPEMNILIGMDRIGQLHIGLSLIYHMDGEELAGTVGGDPQLIASVGVEVALAQGDRDTSDRTRAMLVFLIELPVQLNI